MAGNKTKEVEVQETEEVKDITVKASQNIKLDNDVYKIGDILTLGENQADELIKLGYVEKVGD